MRKQYRTIIWSVGILEKVILRWRRKGSGLRGYKEPTPPPQPQAPLLPAKEEDDYDFLKEGRKQTEERLQKALTRVKSMVQYPDARAQYRRLLTVVEGIRDNKVKFVNTPSSSTTNLLFLVLGFNFTNFLRCRHLRWFWEVVQRKWVKGKLTMTMTCSISILCWMMMPSSCL